MKRSVRPLEDDSKSGMLNKFAGLCRRFFRNRKTSLSEEDIQSIIDVGEEEGIIDQEEHDNIIGIVYAKDLLKFWGKDEEAIPLERVMRQPYFIPETKRLEELLKEFKTKRIHMAIVVDEYGGLLGLVTIEDLIEEVFGEIEDEYDQRMEGRMIRLGDGSISVDAKLEIEELESYFDVEIQKENFETVGGFIFHLLGRVPRAGERVDFGDMIMTIESVDGRRIERVKITRSRVEGKNA